MNFKKQEQKITKDFLFDEFKEYAPFGAGNKGIESLTNAMVDHIKKIPIKFLEYLKSEEKLNKLQALLGGLDGLEAGEHKKDKLIAELQTAAYLPHVEQDADMMNVYRLSDKLDAIYAVKIKHIIRILEQQGWINSKELRYPANLYEFYKFIDYVFGTRAATEKSKQNKKIQGQGSAPALEPQAADNATASTPTDAPTLEL